MYNQIISTKSSLQVSPKSSCKGLVALIGLLSLVGMIGIQRWSRLGKLPLFQKQESWAFQQSVDQALREALDLAGISAEVIQEMPKEKRAI